MTHLSYEGTRTLSHRERVAAEQPGEGLRSLAGFESRIRWPRRSSARNVNSAANFFDHPVQPFLDLVIGEPQFKKSMAFDNLAPRRVNRELVFMLLAVNLDCQAEFVAKKSGKNPAMDAWRRNFSPSKLRPRS